MNKQWLFVAGMTLSAMALAGGTHKQHHPEAIALPADAAPTVTLHVSKDALSGWNLHVETTRFRFAPERVNQTDVAGEGHAHLYINGRKSARLYGPWYHLDALPAGTHRLTVELNGNSHAPLTVNGQQISDTKSIENR